MRKSIYILFLLLIGCAPVATVAPTLTSLPPTSTVTPSPTATLEPTATPSAPRETEGGGVEVWDGAKWANIPIPDTIWGDQPEGASIVLKDGEAVLQMSLTNFQTPDGSTSVDIAEFNAETNKWEVKPFSVTRTLPLQNYEMADINNSIKKYDDPEGVDLLSSMATFLGLRVAPDNSGSNRVEFMILYKGQPVVVAPQEIWKNAFGIENASIFGLHLVDENGLSLQSVLEAISGVEKNNNASGNINGAFLKVFVLNEKADKESCNHTWDITNKNNNNRRNFREWCKTELGKGADRKIPNKSNLDWALKNQPEVFVIDEDFDLNDLNKIWDLNPALGVEGAFITAVFGK